MKLLVTCFVICGLHLSASDAAPPAAALSEYVLGPDDIVSIKVSDLEEFSNLSVPIPANGKVTLPLVGEVMLAGLTTSEAEKAIAKQLLRYLQDAPSVMLQISQYRAQPVSVLGAANTPGVIQVRGNRSLMEVLSLAGGLRTDAGNSILISRPKSSGSLPLPGAHIDASGEFQIAELNVKALMEAQFPTNNIAMKGGDVISIPKAKIIYVLGCVRRSGGFVLNERDYLSVIQALSMAEGLDVAAAETKARILRPKGDGERVEIAVNLKRILAGEAEDLRMKPDDILFVPSSAMKKSATLLMQSAIQIGTGIAIFK